MSITGGCQCTNVFTRGDPSRILNNSTIDKY